MDLYTAIAVITLMLLAVSVIDIRSSRVAGRAMKRNGTWTCVLIGLAQIFEWVGVRINGVSSSPILLHELVKMAEFCVSPLIGVMAAASYGHVRHAKLIAALSVLHLAFEAAALPFGWVIRVDAANVYHRGFLYPIYIILCSLSVLFCVVNSVQTDLKYYARSSLLLYATLAFLIAGIGMQIADSHVRTDYLCAAASSYFLFNHRRRMIFQLDGLTRLLSRRCYEKDIEKIISPSVILLMDVNNFKKLNDTCGHAAGDRYLKEIAEIIHNVYGRFGSCYRYGGDEFCVIMTKSTERAEERLRLFDEMLEKRRKSDERFPGVSVGYARYDRNSESVQNVLREADESMYRTKSENKESM